MNSPGTLDWAFAAIGWAAGVFGAVLLVWALFRDRSRGRRRCPGCWYEMAGVPGLRCPECGREQRRERSLLRTRRRWVWAGVGAALLGGGIAVYSVPEVRERGWPALVPGTLLVFVAPAKDEVEIVAAGAAGAFWVARAAPRARALGQVQDPTVGHLLTNELWRRLSAGKLATWQGALFMRRYYRGDPESKLGPHIHLPARCARDRPLLIESDAGCPLPMQVRAGGGPWTGLDRDVGAHTVIQLGRRAGPAVALDLRFAPAGQPAGMFRLSRTIELRESLDDLLDRLESPADTERVLRAMRPRLKAHGESLMLEFDDGRGGATEDDLDFIVSFEVEVRLEGRVIARGRSHKKIDAIRLAGIAWLTREAGEDVAAADLAGRAELVLRGDAAGSAARYTERFRWAPRPACWAGVAVVPVDTVVQMRRPAALEPAGGAPGAGR